MARSDRNAIIASITPVELQPRSFKGVNSVGSTLFFNTAKSERSTMRFLRTLRTTRATLSTAASAAAPAAGGSAAGGSAAPQWVQSMPTRAIAHVLMQRETRMAPHEELFHEVERMGMVKSHSHFKHCLKMMKLQKRVNVLCLGLVRVGSAKRKFAVKLTNRGNAVYRYYRNCEDRAEQNEGRGETKEERGLKDAV